MTVKLTLSLSKETVEKAKRIAARNGTSVSKMVQDFFEALPEAPKKSIVEEMHELMAPHRERILKSIPKGKSYRDLIGEWRYEDYMKDVAERSVKNRRQTK